MIDFENETSVPISEASKHIPGNPHVATIYRWMNRSERPLEYFKVGGKTFTTREAIVRFIRGCTDPTASPTAPTARQRQRRQEAAERELRAAGILK